MDIVAVYERRKAPALGAAQNKPLLRGAVFSFAPCLRLKRHMGIGAADFRWRRPAGRAVLAIAHGFELDAVEIALLGRGHNH